MTSWHEIQYVSQHDIDVVLSRLPRELTRRVRDVFLNGDSLGVRRGGWVTRRGRRDIVICGILPIRVSMKGFMFAGRKAQDFGAPANGQWPPWAVRRQILYDTLLHEIGHLQLVETRDGWDGEFGHEAVARELANEWHGRLYSEPFDHSDPVHNAPTDDELACIPWFESLDKPMRAELTRTHLKDPGRDLAYLGDLPAPVSRFLQKCQARTSIATTRQRPMRSKRWLQTEQEA